jgi:hypothetical protein
LNFIGAKLDIARDELLILHDRVTDIANKRSALERTTNKELRDLEDDKDIRYADAVQAELNARVAAKLIPYQATVAAAPYAAAMSRLGSAKKQYSNTRFAARDSENAALQRMVLGLIVASKPSLAMTPAERIAAVAESKVADPSVSLR